MKLWASLNEQTLLCSLETVCNIIDFYASLLSNAKSNGWIGLDCGRDKDADQPLGAGQLPGESDQKQAHQHRNLVQTCRGRQWQNLDAVQNRDYESHTEIWKN